MLEEAGYPTREAGDADEAMRVLADGVISILIADIEMPGSMDGLALARSVRATRPGMAVIIASGHRLPRPEELPEGSAFLSKPFSAERLLSVVRDRATDRRQGVELAGNFFSSPAVTDVSISSIR